jgi:branched-chain amino acid transport system ATP-binding protein
MGQPDRDELNLRFSDISVRYGDAVALVGASHTVSAGSALAVVGANGAGKSSLGLALAGLVRSTGRVWLGEHELTGARTAQRVRAGIVYVPEGRRIFAGLSVLENLRSGAFSARRKGNPAERIEHILDLLPQLRERVNVNGDLLSGGEQQLLAIGRALMARPRVLILDEPSLGLASEAVDRVSGFLRALIDREGLTVVILEQNVLFASRMATSGLVLHLGQTIRTFDEAEIRDTELVTSVLAASEHGEVARSRQSTESGD